jgi:hypothetical protein
MQIGATMPESNPSLNVNFFINQYSTSGIKFSRLDILGEVLIIIFKSIFLNILIGFNFLLNF